MGTLFFDCSMGAAGDMICAALFELVPDSKRMLDKLNNMGLPNVEYIPQKCEKQGVTGTSMVVRIHGEEEEDHHHGPHGHTHAHMRLRDIEGIVSSLSIPEEIKAAVYMIYQMIAEAESKAHNCRVEEVHFHEVGAMDAVADITAACMLMNELNPGKVMATPVHVGSGTVKCAHGILPVPAPATANILKGIPYYSADIYGELCTPTGAALLKFFVQSFENAEVMAGRVGRGMGKREFKRPSFLAAYLS